MNYGFYVAGDPSLKGLLAQQGAQLDFLEEKPLQLVFDGDDARYTVSGDVRMPGWHMFPLPGQAVFDRDKQQIAAVSRAGGNLDLFVIGFDNHVWTTFWNEGGWNGDWFPLPGQAVFDRDKQQIAAVSPGTG
ncbi:MAG: hypothetical protein R2932_11490 [Caldilineaceae bacterium]